MSGNSIFIDTNIALYLLAGDSTMKDLLYGKRVFISAISQLELLSYHKLTANERAGIKEFINQCTGVELTEQVKKSTILLRKKYNFKLPDSIIVASALVEQLPLLTTDKQLEKTTEVNTVIYTF
jgi:hypothetical protein